LAHYGDHYELLVARFLLKTDRQALLTWLAYCG
jgi:hypothetical protein